MLHAYTCEGYENYGPIPVIHVASPDFRQRPDATRAEVFEELTRAYTNVFTIFNHSGLWSLRLQPISGGTLSGRFQTTLPALTVDAIHTAYNRLPPSIQATLQTTSIELCIYYEADYKYYIDAFKKFANKTPEVHAYDPKITDAATQPAATAEVAPVSCPSVAEALPAARPTLGLSIRKRPYSYMTRAQLQQYPQQPPIYD